jgi:predicted nuclease of predicted toxin-antitoxin system
VKFVVDAQLPPALARLLREVGCDAFAVREIGLREASDAEIWRYAVQQQAAITQRMRTSRSVASIVEIRR